MACPPVNSTTAAPVVHYTCPVFISVNGQNIKTSPTSQDSLLDRRWPTLDSHPVATGTQVDTYVCNKVTSSPAVIHDTTPNPGADGVTSVTGRFLTMTSDCKASKTCAIVRSWTYGQVHSHHCFHLRSSTKLL